MSWALTPTALLRHPAPPVFLQPKHWPLGCWDCGRVECRQPPESRIPLIKQRPPRAPFRFPDAPTLGERRDAMAEVHPVLFDDAHDRWRAAMQAAHQHNGWLNVDDIAIARGLACRWPRGGSPK